LIKACPSKTILAILLKFVQSLTFFISLRQSSIFLNSGHSIIPSHAFIICSM
jgi:hypothetical protein